ncbi:hypothetical protein BJP40_22425 [Streptomyces sp. CC53]|uniref:hypothetical protein n=1 Tax=unclassified Streptomyces TaxID=2593676 RepID=UPI0008DE09EB|nr:MULTISPECIES: hypothetical protein [unclassified Streptomyces]OII63888.1 hypothetical protein BJP40_22425 [Streptomyces sp. CC53]
MTVDPTDPETLTENGEEESAAGLDDEAPEADAAEQHTELRQHQDEPLTGIDPAAANEADAVEQRRVVALDEDDYR